MQFQDNIKEAGEIGLTMVLAGIGGAILCGIILDRTRAYKYVINRSIIVVYNSASLLKGT